MKICSKCLMQKDFNEFYKCYRLVDGRTSWCKSCYKRSGHNYRKDNKEKYSKARKLRYQKSIPTYKESAWKRYGIKNNDGSKFTVNDYNQLYLYQSGCCGICYKHQEQFLIKFAADHDHKTGIIRGLLCGSCNRTLGKFENEHFSNKIKRYLTSSPK